MDKIHSISNRKYYYYLIGAAIFFLSVLGSRIYYLAYYTDFFLVEHTYSFPQKITMNRDSRIVVAYYITGHGLGHATRSLELIRGMLSTGNFVVHTVTTVNETFFLQELQSYNISTVDDKGQALYRNWFRNLDTGGIQKDVIHLDPFETLERYYQTVHVNRNSLLEQEIYWAREQKIDLVLMDSTQFGTAVAKALGKKSVFVTNFTWNFIFQEMLKAVESQLSAEQRVKYQNMIDVCEKDVLGVDHFIRYPGGTPLPSLFDEKKVIDGPLVTRPVKNKNLRKQLGIEDSTKVLVLGFGGHAADWHLEDTFLPDGWICLVLRADPSSMPSPRFRVMPEDTYVPDLIYAADAVLGKIGYGFVSECLSAGTALIYIPRVYWPEEKYLEDVLAVQYRAGVRLPLEDYNRGNWKPFIEEALLKHRSWVIEAERHPDRATNIVIRQLLRLFD